MRDLACSNSQRVAWTFQGALEFSCGFEPRPGIRHVLFDFDGTLSLIREGWPEVMVPMYAEMLPALPGEGEEARRALALDDVMRLNGKQTIYQMLQLAERIAARGGVPRDPLEYKREYLRRLDARIARRVAGLESGRVAPDDLLVHRARPFLDELLRRGFILHLASGTDESCVVREAALLGLTEYFDGRIYGAQDEYRRFSKRLVIARILRENAVRGAALLSFGDGYVEIEDTKAAGGLAIAVASDEARNGSGRVDPWKRRRLLGVGADVVIPDYRDAKALLVLLLGQ